MHRNEREIRPADVLVGLTWEPHSHLLRLLKDSAVTLRGILGIPHLPSSLLPYRRAGAIPLDAAAKKVIRAAGTEADRDGQYWIDSDHILRGLLSFPNEAAAALASVGCDLASARVASIEFRRDSPQPPAPTWGRIKLWMARNW